MSDNVIARLGRVLVVVAHPDDESFGLGAVIAGLVRDGCEVDVICLTRGEASTLGAQSDGRPADLATVRERELASAGRCLGTSHVELHDHPDGMLADEDEAALRVEVDRAADAHGAGAVLVFDPEGGVTGHPDHRAASLVGLAVGRARGIPVLGWALPREVTDALSEEYGVPFHGYAAADLDIVLIVDREVQRCAIAAHASQAVPGSVLWRRLELLGDREHLRWLHRP